MKNENEILTPDEGMMLYREDVWSDSVMLGSLDSETNWEERPIAEYEEWLQSQEQEEGEPL